MVDMPYPTPPRGISNIIPWQFAHFNSLIPISFLVHFWVSGIINGESFHAAPLYAILKCKCMNNGTHFGSFTKESGAPCNC